VKHPGRLIASYRSLCKISPYNDAAWLTKKGFPNQLSILGRCTERSTGMNGKYTQSRKQVKGPGLRDRSALTQRLSTGRRVSQGDVLIELALDLRAPEV
jgi:hypothetical protein